MSTTTTIDVANGVWDVDVKHSTANFEVEHAGVSTFRGSFKPVGAKLTATDDGLVLEGKVAVKDIDVEDEDIRPHLLSPEFFDADRSPAIEFRSTEITGDPGDLQVTGELGMAGFTLPVAARGRLRGPVDIGGIEKLSLALEATIDRTKWGMNWQMELPSGGVALANEVKLIVELEFNRS
jgi:polyisoprenoid-binding protein YceI